MPGWAGQTIENPVTGERMFFRRTGAETAGELLEIDLFVRPGGFVSVEHIHPRQEERLKVMAGNVRFRLNGREKVWGPGETVVVPPGTRHVWWQAGDEDLHMVLEFRPALNLDEFFAMVFGRARDGKTDTRGSVGLLQFSVMARGRFKDLFYVAKPPIPVQRILFTLVAPVARAMGYRDAYPAPIRENLPRAASR
jgi:quercetin dioxygenase-like cupin family protein